MAMPTTRCSNIEDNISFERSSGRVRPLDCPVGVLTAIVAERSTVYPRLARPVVPEILRFASCSVRAMVPNVRARTRSSSSRPTQSASMLTSNARILALQMDHVGQYLIEFLQAFGFAHRHHAG